MIKDLFDQLTTRVQEPYPSVPSELDEMREHLLVLQEEGETPMPLDGDVVVQELYTV